MSIMSGATAGVRSASASSPTSSGIGLDEPPAAGRPDVVVSDDDGRPRRCTASGWRLRLACTDGIGTAICPVCGQQVAAAPDRAVGPGVWAIKEHLP
jgi:hypothetical protein